MPGRRPHPARSLLHRGLLLALAAALLGLTPVATAPAAPAAPAPADETGCLESPDGDWPIWRVSGTDRWGTAACVSTTGFPDGAPAVVLARGDDAGGFADALAGTVLAAYVRGPVLLTATDDLPTATADELARLDPAEVFVLGGPAAVSDRVVAEVRAVTGHAERIRGADRAATAAAIADRVGGTEAFVVNSHRPADALSAGAAAARAGAALLLTGTDDVPTATLDALDGRTDVTIVGGPGVVSDIAATTIRDLDIEVARLGGPTRYETAATVARRHPGDGVLHVVGGADGNLVDAIPAGWLAASTPGGPVLYTRRDDVDRGTDRHLRLGGLRTTTKTMVVGGRASVSDAGVTALSARYDEAADGGPPAELRAMWVHLFDDSLKTRTGIEAVLDAAAAANLNTVIVQGARRHDAFYDSDVLPATTDPVFNETPDLDMLAELVPAAHARGLQVHVWYSVMPAIHSSMGPELPLPAGHVHTEHGPASDDPWTVPREFNTDWYDFLDPAIPGVQDHVAAMVREVVERYDIDGVHLDYLRYEVVQPTVDTPPGTQHPTTMARYDAHGDGMELDEFLRTQVTDLARRVFLEVADVDPTVVVSAALIAQGDGPRELGGFDQTRTWWMKGQDWPSWLAEGLVDHAFPMAYFREQTPRWQQAFDDWVDFTAGLDTDAYVSAVGQGSWLNCARHSADQLERALAVLDGAGLYSYQGDVVTSGADHDACPADAPGALRRLVVADGEVFDDPAPVPDVTRRSQPTQGHILVAAADGDDVIVESTDGSAYLRRTDATGRAGFTWLDLGTYEVRRGTDIRIVTVTAGQVTHVDLTP